MTDIHLSESERGSQVNFFFTLIHSVHRGKKTEPHCVGL